MVVKHKKKHKDSSTCLIVCGACICLLFMTIVSVQLFKADSFPMISSLMGPIDHKSLEKYEEVLKRARALTLRYRNITGTVSVHDGDILTLAPAKHLTAASAAISEHSKKLTPVTAKQASVLPPDKLQMKKMKLSEMPSGSSGSAQTQLLDIVIGMAQDTDAKNLAVFCTSLRKVSAAEVYIFVNAPIPTRHQEIADNNKINLVSFEPKSLSPEMQAFHPSTLRWPLIYRYFQSDEVRSKYGRVWMADVRDAFFQEDPFKMLPLGTRGFYAFQGVESITIRDCGWNSGWIRDCFGTDILARVGNNKIICSGVSMGDMKSVYDYLRLMDDIVMARGKASISQSAKFPKCERNGVDQGIHNVLVHQQMIPGLKIWSHTDGPVANLQAQKSRINSGKVFNQVGDTVAVVHQYDRRPDLQKLLFASYVYWIDTNDVEAEWAAETACNVFVVKKTDIDLYKGVCDMKSQGGATSAASCCAFCQKKPGCKSFTFFSSVCYLKSCTQSRGATSLPGAVSAGTA